VRSKQHYRLRCLLEASLRAALAPAMGYGSLPGTERERSSGAGGEGKTEHSVLLGCAPPLVPLPHTSSELQPLPWRRTQPVPLRGARAGVLASGAP